MICATNQLISHLDKLPIITEGRITPNIIIRTFIGSERHLFFGQQHIGNISDAYRKMLTRVEIIELKESDQIYKA